LHKEGNHERVAAVLRFLLEGMRKTALNLWPVMPDASRAMLEQLGLQSDPLQINAAEDLDDWETMKFGVCVASKSNLFPRREFSAPEPEKEKPAPAKQPKVKSDDAKQDLVEFADFARLDLRLGTIVSVERVPKADRLYAVEVDLGEDKPRPIVAGLAEHWSQEELLGRQVVVVANLKPRKLRGRESQGMILAVTSEDRMALLGASHTLPAGSKVS
jgi:methionyl-tRNA synthetase